MKYLVLPILLSIVACTTPTKVKEYVAYDCPIPNVCAEPIKRQEIKTNGDLVRAYVEVVQENEECRIVVNTLTQCIRQSQDIIRKSN